MHLVFAPSGRRIIPYPPVGVALLASALQLSTAVTVVPVDLEMLLAARRLSGVGCLLYDRRVTVEEVLAEHLADEVAEYADLLWDAVGAAHEADVGISVMGFDQIASALLLARAALAHRCRVMFGGQFFTPDSARQVLSALRPHGSVTVTVGDGWEAVVDFVRGRHASEIANSYTMTGHGEVSGPQVTAKGLPPSPTYDWVPWVDYERFGSHAYREETPVRRAHLYVWDKQCNFRCAFCRVASGSKAVLSPPGVAAESFVALKQAGVTQANFMTNELNPSRKYLLRFLDAMEGLDAGGTDWFTYVRADRLEGDDFARMRRLGARLARYGVESGSQDLLDLMRKDYQVPTIEHTLAAAAGEDLWNHVNFLVGFPGEREQDIDNTVAFIERNAASIHSVRVNPFYLPPQTPIARTPADFGIELTGFDAGWWNYRQSDGSEPDPDLVVARVERITSACAENGIGFAGTDPFFLLDTLARHPSRDGALASLKTEYAPFWTPAPTDVYKALIGGYSVSAEWRDTALKRQDNYALTLTPGVRSTTCTD